MVFRYSGVQVFRSGFRVQGLSPVVGGRARFPCSMTLAGGGLFSGAHGGRVRPAGRITLGRAGGAVLVPGYRAAGVIQTRKASGISLDNALASLLNRSRSA